MSLENLLKMSEEELKREHATARRTNNIEDVTLINTVRIRNIILSSLWKFDTPRSSLTYYECDSKTYFIPKVSSYTPSVEGDIEWLIAAHISALSPVSVDIELLKKLIASDRIEFEKSQKAPEGVEFPSKNNIVNYTYLTEDEVRIDLPDIWVPNGEEELQVAVDDMPKQDKGAVLLTNCASYLTIGNYVTSNRTFTDVFYSHNGDGDNPKAIVLNDIAGIDVHCLEAELQRQGVFYTKKENARGTICASADKTPIDLDLSTIWTAKYLEIVKTAIDDSKEKENFSPSLARIQDLPCQIVMGIVYGGQNVGLRATYNTVILFDDKLILYDDKLGDSKKEEIVKLFATQGIPAIVTSDPIDLSPFESSSGAKTLK